MHIDNQGDRYFENGAWHRGVSMQLVLNLKSQVMWEGCPAGKVVFVYQLLKLEALVSSGGEAKVAIDDGQVLVNGAVETRRRKKIITGDIIEFEKQQFIIVLKSE